MTTNSQLRLERFELARLHIESRSAESIQENSDEDIDVRYACNRQEDSLSFRITFGVTVRRRTGGKGYQLLEMDIRVFFSFVEGTEEDAIQQFIPSVLYAHATGIVRHLLAQATANTNAGPYWLPLLNVSVLSPETPTDDSKPPSEGLAEEEAQTPDSAAKKSDA